MTTTRPRAWTLALAAIPLAALAACGPSNAADAGSSAKAAASSALANPTVSADLATLENDLLANLQTEIKNHPAHPAAGVRAAVADTFPAGGTAKIEQYAAAKFTPGVLKPGTTRQQWLQGVATYALSLGSATATPAGSGS